MRLPVRSESDAFRLAFATALVVGIALLVGYVTTPLVGVALFTLVALAALVWDLAARDPAGEVPPERRATSRDDAHRRALVVQETVAAARRHGLDAHGEVGDPIDPAMSILDELRRYEVDEVMVVTHPRERMNWLEDRTLSQVREQIALPTTHVVIDPDADEVDVEWPATR